MDNNVPVAPLQAVIAFRHSDTALVGLEVFGRKEHVIPRAFNDHEWMGEGIDIQVIDIRSGQHRVPDIRRG